MMDDLVKFIDSFSKSGRSEDLAQIAREYNFEFSDRQTFGSQITSLKYFKLFDRKGTKRLIGVIKTEIPDIKSPMRFYDFLVTKDLETKTTSVVEIDCPDLFSAAFRIKPRRGFKKLGRSKAKKLGIHPDFKEFHSRFNIELLSEFEKPMLNRSALDLLLDFPRISVEGNENHIIFYRRNKEVNLKEIPEFLDLAEEFVRRLFSSETEVGLDYEDYV